MAATHGGKGSTQRPISDWKKFDENWDAIFKKGDKKTPIDKPADRS